MEANSLSYKLYTDHLEEVDFLLTQRVALFSDPEVDWPEVEEFEKRLQAHIKGLVQGGKAADEVAAEFLASDDPDNVRAAVFALARSKSPDALDRIWSAMEKATPETASAYIDGLKHMESTTLDSKLVEYLGHSSADIRVVAVSLLGYRRSLDPGAAQKALQDKDPRVLKAACSACCSGGLSACVPLLLDLVSHEEPLIGAEAALALCVYQMPEGYHWLRKICQAHPVEPAIAAVYLALNGRTGDHLLFTEKSEELSPDEVEALGIIGDPAALPFLIKILRGDNPLQYFDAATSLAQITGAPLEEEYTEKDDFVNYDGEVVDTAESTYTRVSTSADDWAAWWSKNEGQFTPGQRYRNGQPFSSSAVIADIKDPRSKIRRRRLDYLELLINQSITEPFEADWFVARQVKQLSRW